jgi:ankyrin repeat protein
MDIPTLIFNNNYKNLIEQINEKNVNNILDKKTKYTAIHYAIKNNSSKIIDYLLSIGANYYLKTSDGESCSDLALKYQCKFFFSKIDNDRSILKDRLEDIQYDKIELEYKIKDYKKEIEKVTKINIKNKDEVKKVKNIFDKLKQENEDLLINYKELYEENEKLYDLIDKLEKNEKKISENISNLQTTLKCMNDENINLKRKYDDLDQSYDGMLKKIRKE